MPPPPAPSIPALREALRNCALFDQRRLRRRLDAASHLGSNARAHAERLADIARAVERSAQGCDRRRAGLPRIGYPPDLPVSARRDEIARAIVANQVVVVCGETGSGKSTQLPKICLEMGLGVYGLIGHTQPRRIAARSVAARVASELGTDTGGVVGFKVRFGDETSDRNMVKVLTDGMLLAETQGDPLLDRYEAIIIDEAHERSLNIDFLLGYLRQLLPKRPDLKVIITSATIDPDRFARHFSLPGRPPVPVLSVSGRTYPVDVVYQPVEGDDEDARDDSMERGVVQAVETLCGLGPGDILVFLCGEREIRETAELLEGASIRGVGGRERLEILPLFARLSTAEQMAVFDKGRQDGRRRVVLATNIAETSVTVPGIRFVVDTGLVRLSRYSAKTKVQRLPIETISQASANQRAGRCGRLGPGVCVRLYREEDYAAAPAFTEPEILRTNLASVILQMKSMRLGEPADFPFVEAPDARLIADGYDTLFELGAVVPAQPERPGAEAQAANAADSGSPGTGGRWRLTDLGRKMARLPIDPRLARVILAAIDLNCLGEVLVIAAALSVQDPRERPINAQAAADEKHAQWRDPDSDLLSYLRLWRFFRESASRLGASKLRRLCRENHLSYVRMREWQDVERQLRDMVADLDDAPPSRGASPAQSGGRRAPAPGVRGAPIPGAAGHGWDGGDGPSYEEIHAAVLAGMVSNVGVKAEQFEYNGCRGAKFAIYPGSGLFRNSPKWIVATELVRTTKLFARGCAKVRPEWVERAAAHLIKRSHTDPFWNTEQQRVLALERGTLFGLEVYAKRAVHFGPINPAEARSIFIHHALVEGEVRSTGRFIEHNRAVVEKVRLLEQKLRRPDLLADVTRRAAFFEARVPPEVCTTAAFEAWRQRAEREQPRILFMAEEDVLAHTPDPDAHERFPDQTDLGGVGVELVYRSKPGDNSDGVTALIPVEALNRVDHRHADWLVPGLLAEKIETLIRTLPKHLRVRFVPAPQFARAAAAELRPGPRPLDEALAEWLTAAAGETISPGDFRGEEVPAHLRMNFGVVDRAGRVLAQGRELAPIRRELGASLDKHLAALPNSAFNRRGVTSWDFGDLPPEAEIERDRLKVRGVPVLDDEGDAAALRLVASPTAAPGTHWRGLRRLFALACRRDAEKALQRFPNWNRLALLFGPLGPGAELKAQLIDRTAERAFLADVPRDAPIAGPAVRTRAEFEARLLAGEARVHAAATEAATLALNTLTAAQAAKIAFDAVTAAAMRPAVADAAHHLSTLLVRGFLRDTPWDALTEFPRYVAGVRVRAERLSTRGAAALARDLAGAAECRAWFDRYAAQARLNAERQEPDAHLDALRWMIEEYRVSLFAQELGTRYPVSARRLEKQWELVRVG